MSIESDFLIQSVRANKNFLKSKNLTNINREIKYPCSMCNYDVKHNDKALYCTTCEHWIHIKCNQTTLEEYKSMQMINNETPELIDEPYDCLKCVMEKRGTYSSPLYN